MSRAGIEPASARPKRASIASSPPQRYPFNTFFVCGSEWTRCQLQPHTVIRVPRSLFFGTWGCNRLGLNQRHRAYGMPYAGLATSLRLLIYVPPRRMQTGLFIAYVLACFRKDTRGAESNRTRRFSHLLPLIVTSLTEKLGGGLV